MTSKSTKTVDINPNDPIFSDLNKAMEEIARKDERKTRSIWAAITDDINKFGINAVPSQILQKTYRIGLHKIADGETIPRPIAWIRAKSRQVIKTWNNLS